MVDINKRKEKVNSRDKGDVKVRDKVIKKRNENNKENELGVSKERRVSSRIKADKMDIDGEKEEKEKVEKEEERGEESTGNT